MKTTQSTPLLWNKTLIWSNKLGSYSIANAASFKSCPSTPSGMIQFYHICNYQSRKNNAKNNLNDCFLLLLIHVLLDDDDDLPILQIIYKYNCNEYHQKCTRLLAYTKWSHLARRHHSLATKTTYTRVCGSRAWTSRWKCIWQKFCKGHCWMPQLTQSRRHRHRKSSHLFNAGW